VPEVEKLVINQLLTVYTPHDLGEILNAKERLF
jgi:hypothetical protein